MTKLAITSDLDGMVFTPQKIAWNDSADDMRLYVVDSSSTIFCEDRPPKSQQNHHCCSYTNIISSMDDTEETLKRDARR